MKEVGVGDETMPRETKQKSNFSICSSCDFCCLLFSFVDAVIFFPLVPNRLFPFIYLACVCVSITISVKTNKRNTEKKEKSNRKKSDEQERHTTSPNLKEKKNIHALKHFARFLHEIHNIRLHTL